jgi:hypothetical protein
MMAVICVIIGAKLIGDAITSVSSQRGQNGSGLASSLRVHTSVHAVRFRWRTDSIRGVAMTLSVIVGSFNVHWGGFHLTGGQTFIDLVAATTNALNAALLARRPDHYKNFTIVGILLMALLGGLSGGV